MLFIERDKTGQVIALRQGEGEKGKEEASIFDKEVMAFLQDSGKTDTLAQLLALSDTSIIRVLEDLIDLLIAKKIILLTDLPQEAQEKLRERKRVRKKLHLDDIMVDDIL